MTASPLHPDSVLLITLDSCRYDSFRRSTTPAMDRVGPLHLAMAPSHFTFGSHAAIFKGFLPSVSGEKPLLIGMETAITDEVEEEDIDYSFEQMINDNVATIFDDQYL